MLISGTEAVKLTRYADIFQVENKICASTEKPPYVETLMQFEDTETAHEVFKAMFKALRRGETPFEVT